MNSVLMIGGGVQQLPAVQVAQSLGFTVVVTDRNPAAHCFPHADFTAVIDGRDIEGLTAFTLLSRERLNIKGVFTLTELVTSVAAVGTGAGLPSVSLSSAVACQNKALSKLYWQAHGIPTPRGGIAYTWDEAVEVFRELDGPAVVKPAVGFGGQGVRFVVGLEQLQLLFAKHAKISTSSPLVIEEQVRGTMHDVNGLIDRAGCFHPLGIVDRSFLEEPVEHEIRTPSQLTETQQAELYQLLECGARALGVDFGPVKGDAVLGDSGFQLLEIAPRLHGPRNSLYALPMTGAEVLVPALLLLTGNEVPLAKLTTQQNCCCIGQALLPQPGRILRIVGVEDAVRLPGIEHVMLFAEEGDVVPTYRNSTHVPGYVFATGETFEACRKALNRAQSTIEFKMELPARPHSGTQTKDASREQADHGGYEHHPGGANR